VVRTLGDALRRSETADVHSCQEVTMLATIDKRDAKDRTIDHLAGLAEDAAFLVMIFSGVVIIATLIAVAFVV
jgi:hypothetical protein